MYAQYFQEQSVRSEFNKEFISLWNGWLGAENIHKLDEVTEPDWMRFSQLLALICARYKVLIANPDEGSCKEVSHTSELMQTYDAAMAKDSSKFIRLIIPELDCALTEDWDFTYILWHRNRFAVEALAPLIAQAKLHHFSAVAI